MKKEKSGKNKNKKEGKSMVKRKVLSESHFKKNGKLFSIKFADKIKLDLTLIFKLVKRNFFVFFTN